MAPDGTTIILGIESSCDETAAAVLVDGVLRSNVIAGQDVHRIWGGVVPELASRAHQEHIVPVVDEALRQAGVEREQLSGIAFTQGPGLIGALLVGACYARSMAQALHVPLLAVHHIQAHVLAHFVRDQDPRPVPAFPFLNLTVSGGHTQLVLVRGPLDMQVVGTTLDDAAGEAFDKGAKLMGLPYPGGPLVDRYAAQGDPLRHRLPKPLVPGLDFSFSGVKTAFMNLVRKGEQAAPGFVERERDHLCASLQHAIVEQLLRRTRQAARELGIHEVAIAGGVSANSELRRAFAAMGREEGWTIHITPFAYCTDNAAMIAVAGAFLLEAGRIAPLDTVPQASMG
jgi:N6-L-threonylcarbamoyladenine synthase